jgi:GNAT superfamily N-acetyltransferase
MLIRSANPIEAEYLSRIAFAAKAHWGYAEEQLAFWRNDLAFTPASIELWPTLVAEVNNNPAGVVQINPTTEPWDLEALWVHPTAMGQGIGKALLNAALQAARAGGQLSLTIDSDPNAEAFYVACGARRVGQTAAPIHGQPARFRPQLTLAVTQ